MGTHVVALTSGERRRMARRTKGSRLPRTKSRLRGAATASGWGSVPLLFILIVIVLVIVLRMTGISLPHSPLLPR